MSTNQNNSQTANKKERKKTQTFTNKLECEQNNLICGMNDFLRNLRRKTICTLNVHVS